VGRQRHTGKYQVACGQIRRILNCFIRAAGGQRSLHTFCIHLLDQNRFASTDQVAGQTTAHCTYTNKTYLHC